MSSCPSSRSSAPRPDRATKPLGTAALQLVTAGFEGERDPYGRKWKRPIVRDGQTLSDTGVLKNAWRVSADKRTVTLRNATRYAAIHQFGGVIVPKRAKALRFQLGDRWVTVQRVRMPSRQMVPTSDGLGKTWERAFAAEVRAVIEELLK